MTAPDSPAVAAARLLAASYREGYVHVGEMRVGAVLDGVLAELDEARRQPPVRPARDGLSDGKWFEDDAS